MANAFDPKGTLAKYNPALFLIDKNRNVKGGFKKIDRLLNIMFTGFCNNM